VKALLLTCSASVIIIPCSISTALIIQPYLSPFLGKIILTSGQEHLTVEVIFLSFVNLILLINLTGSGMISVIYGPFLELFALLNHLRQLKEGIKRHKVILPRSNLERRFFCFRQIQLLVVVFNECYQWMFTTGFFFLVYFVISIYLYAVVRFYRLISLPTLMFLLQLLLEGVVLTFIVNTIAGQIHQSSRQITKYWLRQPIFIASVARSRWLRRKVKACSGIKIRIGSVNFIDRLTPFVMIGLCAKLTVRLLMTV
jgi:hypothetical protein